MGKMRCDKCREYKDDDRYISRVIAVLEAPPLPPVLCLKCGNVDERSAIRAEPCQHRTLLSMARSALHYWADRLYHVGSGPALNGAVQVAVLDFTKAAELIDAAFAQLCAAKVEHPDDAAVDRFAAALKAKLAKKREQGAGGWEAASEEWLNKLLVDHLAKGDPVDVGNFAMMLWNNGQRVAEAKR